MLVNIKLDNLDVKMQPVTINEILKFVRNTKLNQSFNLMDEKSDKSSLIEEHKQSTISDHTINSEF